MFQLYACLERLEACCFSAKHAVLRRSSKDWLVWNQDNVSEWGDVSQHYKNPTKHVGLDSSTKWTSSH